VKQEDKSLLIKKAKELTRYIPGVIQQSEIGQTDRLRYKSTGYFNSDKTTMSTQLENDRDFDDTLFQHNLPQYYRSILKQFRKITHTYVSFNLLFLGLFSAELAFFFAFLPFLNRSAILAFALGGLFLTCFSYFVLLFYFQARKPEQLVQLKDQFIQSCRQLLPVPQGEAQHHLSIAEALSKLTAYLHDFEWNFYQTPPTFARLISRFSAYCYWQDVFQMKTLLLQAAVEEHLKQIRCAPTDLEVHASLANTYVSLSKLYKATPETHPRANRYQKNKALYEEKFRAAAKLAIEEFRILSHYAPNDPWVHEQLAVGYRDLGMPEEEVKEVETLLRLRPQDREILFRLGMLYFEQGQNAKGLQVYEELKQANFKKAIDLIAVYGTFRN
jgi:tetratricopeptide (TPR) repeat protein